MAGVRNESEVRSLIKIIFLSVDIIRVTILN